MTASSRPPPPPAPAGASLRLALHLHGRAGVAGADGQRVPLERRAAALLALAALAPGLPRAQAARWLWPDSGDPRRNLRQQMLRFKLQFGRPLIAAGESLRLAEGVMLAEAPVGDAERRELLAGLWADDEAAGDEEVSAEFAAWLRERRQDERQRQAGRQRDALAAAEAGGDLDAAAAAARQWVAADPASEAPRRELMRIHYLRADNAAGLAAYEELERMLRERHGLKPSAPTEGLAQALRSARSASTLPAPAMPPRPAAIPATLLRPPHLVGREREHAALAAALQAGRAALLLGEAGLGKSRLLEDFAARRPTWLVRARPGDAGVPYATLARLLRLRPAAEAAHLGHAERGALAAVLPEWPTLAAASTSAAAPTPTTRVATTTAPQPLDRARVQRALEAWLDIPAGPALAVDDLHFADEASLEMLTALVTCERLAGRAWLFAQRPAEGPRAGADLREALEEAQVLETIELAPLNEAQMTEFVRSLGIPGLDAQGLAAPLVRHTGGNPLFALETLKGTWAESRADSGPERRPEGPVAVSALPRPAAVATLMQRRLRQLGDMALALARVAAIAGEDFSVELAEAVIGVRAVQLASAWGELEAAQIFRDQAFAHDLVAEAARRSVPEALARHLHRAIAAFLEPRQAPPARIAAHWLAAAEPTQALPWLHRAAQQAQAALRRREELAFLQQAAAIEESLGLPAAFQTLTDIWDTLDMADRNGIDDALLERIDRAAALGGDDPARRATAMRLRVHTTLRFGQLAETVALGEQGLALAESAGAWRTQAEIAQAVAAAFHTLGEPVRGLELMQRYLPNVERIADEPGTKGSYYLDLAPMLTACDRLADALPYYERGIELALLDGNAEHAAMGHSGHGFALVSIGHAERGLAAFRQAEQLLAASESSEGADALLLLNLPRALRECGRYAEALQSGERAAAVVGVQLPHYLPLVHGQQGLTWLRLGQQARAQHALAAARSVPAAAPWMGASLALLEARIAAALGQDPRPALQAGLAAAPRDQRRLLRFMLLAEQTQAPGAGEEALAAACDAAAQAERLGLLGAVLALSAMAAPLALRLAETDRARALATRARALAPQVAPFDLYRPAVWLALVHTQRALGDTAAADEALAGAARWIAAALPQVPAPFVDSFLHRNAINVTLLAALREHAGLHALVEPALRLMLGTGAG